MTRRTTGHLAPDVRGINDVVPRIAKLIIDQGPYDLRHFSGVGLGDIDILRCDFGPRTLGLRPGGRHDPWVLLARATAADLDISTADGSAVRVPAGETFLLQLSQAYRIRAMGSGQLTAVTVPASSLCELPGFVQSVSKRVLVGGILSVPTWSFLNSLVDQPLPWAPMAAYFAETLITEMLSSVVLTIEASRSRSTSERSVLRRARAHIAAFARDRRLSTQTIADSLGTSVRSLQRVFADAGQSLSTEMRRARVQAAIALLRSAEASFMSLDEIARSAGYLDAVAMRRAFHSAGARQPRRYRPRSAQAREIRDELLKVASQNPRIGVS
ncbi:helix-turn-helix domain-containing protein [Microbacterium sp. NPDC058342]|uniref:helix-turn-helix domain-containing protein n=1 Tax=Microbacterium sp. NPDC058342 TaxID=3346454 RepID=UPI003646C11E